MRRLKITRENIKDERDAFSEFAFQTCSKASLFMFNMYILTSDPGVYIYVDENKFEFELAKIREVCEFTLRINVRVSDSF